MTRTVTTALEIADHPNYGKALLEAAGKLSS